MIKLCGGCWLLQNKSKDTQEVLFAAKTFQYRRSMVRVCILKTHVLGAKSSRDLSLTLGSAGDGSSREVFRPPGLYPKVWISVKT